MYAALTQCLDSADRRSKEKARGLKTEKRLTNGTDSQTEGKRQRDRRDRKGEKEMVNERQ